MEPHQPFFEEIPHYYGDIVRILFLAAAIVIVGGAPLYADALMQEIPYIVFAALALITLAALTNPRSLWVIRLDAVLAGVIAVVYESWALLGYQTGSPVNFVAREIPALIAMFAFYFALKTLRGMLTGTIGKSAARNEIIPEEQHRTGRGPQPAQEEYYEDGLGHRAAVEDDLGGM